MTHWTQDEERLQKAKDMWRAGYSATVIAIEIGDRQGRPSRSAIIGKMHRLGIATQRPKDPGATERREAWRDRSAAAKKAAETRRNNQARSMPSGRNTGSKPGTMEKPVEITVKPLNLELVDLQRHQCRWPVNTPEKGGKYLFCGHAQAEGSPYCAEHTEASISENSRYARRRLDAQALAVREKNVVPA